MAGKQRKHGVLGILGQLSKSNMSHVEAAELFPQEWVAARLAGRRHTPPPLRVAHVMLSNRYKLIYVKCTKTAGQ